LAVTDWRLRRWRSWFLALSNAPLSFKWFDEIYGVVLGNYAQKAAAASKTMTTKRFTTAKKKGKKKKKRLA